MNLAEKIEIYSLSTPQGISISVSNFGARLIELQTPDRHGDSDNIIAGPTTPEALLARRHDYFGAVIGRYANRIKNGQFTLNGQSIQLSQNDGDNHLHGGQKGFHNVLWSAERIDERTLELHYFSEDGEQGYPGNLDVRVTYRLADENRLNISFEAESDRDTILSMTHHGYYNLHGVSDGSSIDSHRLTVPADHFTEVDEQLIPTGRILEVNGTPLDFRRSKSIGEGRRSDQNLLLEGRVYDHNLVLNTFDNGDFSHVARVEESSNGRVMDLFSNEPGLQFFFCDEPVEGVASAFCLEPQKFPDAPNHPDFPSVLLKAGDAYRWQMVLEFSVMG